MGYPSNFIEIRGNPLWQGTNILELYVEKIHAHQEHTHGSPSRLSPACIDQQIEYLHQPETLYCLCSTLLTAREGRKTLIQLLKLKPDAQSWIDCIQRLVKLPESKWFKVIRRSYGETKEERIRRIYHDIADMQLILNIDDARLEDSTWKLAVNSNVIDTDLWGRRIKSVRPLFEFISDRRCSYFILKLLEEYYESKTSPASDHDRFSINALVESGAPLARRLQWHDRLRRFNPFRRAAHPRPHELGQILVDSDPTRLTLAVDGHYNKAGSATDTKVSICATGCGAADADTIPCSLQTLMPIVKLESTWT